jgi:uncharacterized protein GlcG (DUF336 family)
MAQIVLIWPSTTSIEKTDTTAPSDVRRIPAGCPPMWTRGVPLTSEGEVIAGVGVSGGTTEQDVAIVEAAMDTSDVVSR